MVVVREYVKGGKKCCAQFEVVDSNFYKLLETEVELGDVSVDEKQISIPQFIASVNGHGNIVKN